uniref:Uncharacterized protein n=1 Tax=Anopheles atroparvus TaxID=41427 RepID=A0A182JDI4_ANOAO
MKQVIGLVSIRGGTTELNGEGTSFEVESYIFHPDHVTFQADYDLAIVTIQNSFAGIQNVAGIALQTTELTYSSSRPTWCFALGWGYTDGQASMLSENLQLNAMHPAS